MSPAASGNFQLATGKLAAASSRRINIFILPARFSIFPIENFRQKIKAKNKIQQFIQHFLRNLWLVFLARVDVYFAYFGQAAEASQVATSDAPRPLLTTPLVTGQWLKMS